MGIYKSNCFEPSKIDFSSRKLEMLIILLLQDIQPNFCPVAGRKILNHVLIYRTEIHHYVLKFWRIFLRKPIQESFKTCLKSRDIFLLLLPYSTDLQRPESFCYAPRDKDHPIGYRMHAKGSMLKKYKCHCCKAGSLVVNFSLR